jgi:alpha-tubulin suppressor-like RCC1 family protein
MNIGELIDFSCASSHCLALTVDGEVYGWGSNKGCQLGSNCYVKEVAEPFLLEIPTSEKIISVHTHGGACYALIEGERLWVWEDNSSGQCGFDLLQSNHMCNSPRTVFNVITQ